MSDKTIMNTASTWVTCEVNGNLYFALSSRPTESETGFGAAFNAAYGDNNKLDTALRGFKFHSGLDLNEYPDAVKNATQLHSDLTAYDEKDLGTPSKGFGGDDNIIQFHDTYLIHLKLDKLPTLENQKTDPVWVNVRDMEKINHNGIKTYQYKGGDLGSGQTMTPGKIVTTPGTMYLAEKAVESHRDMKFKDKGFDGLAGFVKANSNGLLKALINNSVKDNILDENKTPITQMGKAIADFYENTEKHLEKVAARLRQ